MTKLAYYIKVIGSEFPSPTNKDDLILKDTLAVIAFQPYSDYNLTVLSLAATLESLRRAEMGRVIVAGSEEGHRNYARDSFQYLADNLEDEEHEYHNNSSALLGGWGLSSGEAVAIKRIGHMELGFAVIPKAEAKTSILPSNMPLGTLLGARKAFVIAEMDPSERTTNQTIHVRQWLGDTHQDPGRFWQYLYLTEPDSILHTRKSSLKQIKAEIDHNEGIIPPWRWQPIAHESDVEGMDKDNLKMLTAADGFGEVIELDSHGQSHDVCCDEYAGDYRPGLNDFPPCRPRHLNTKWWMCGFRGATREEDDPHKRLKPYKMVRFKKGTGLTTIGGNLFGRRCTPAKHTVCKPPFLVE
jgi:hypothetical protein